jgi:hypothetical protein
VVETAQRVTGGAEQSWCFLTAPRGNGDLVVRVSTYVTTATRGDVMPVLAPADAAATRDPDGVAMSFPGLAEAWYGRSVWIDAAGRPTLVDTPVVDHDSLVLTVSESVLATSTFPAVLDPRITIRRPFPRDSGTGG